MRRKDSFTLGVNYWPRKKAMYWWKDFERAEVEAEFFEIVALKLQVVRIFLLWEDFQPQADHVSDHALSDLGTVLDVARDMGLKVMPTFFTGCMSGLNSWPIWALTNKDDPTGTLRMANGKFTTRQGRDPYLDPFMLKAECQLVAAVCQRFGTHPAVYSWNFSNEPDLFFVPKNYTASAVWNQMLAAVVHQSSNLPVSAGMHLPTLTSYNGFRPDLLARANDFLSMHAYSTYYHLTERDDPLNSDVVPLACLVTEALGAFGWMFSDYDPVLWDRPPFDTHIHERFFGLTRYDGSVKPSGEVMHSFADQLATQGVPRRTVGPLKLDAATWYRDPSHNFDRLFREWNGRI